MYLDGNSAKFATACRILHRNPNIQTAWHKNESTKLIDVNFSVAMQLWPESDTSVI